MIETAGLLLLLLILLLAGGVWIAIALMACGWVGMQLAAGGIPAGSVLATTICGHSASWTLAALPLRATRASPGCPGIWRTFR